MSLVCECGAMTSQVCPECKTEPLCGPCKARDNQCAACSVDDDLSDSGDDGADDYDDDDYDDDDDDDDDGEDDE